ncbi:hypothetical protein LCGC14_2862800 [marine sediment metagenome]|uniref:Uncharacterized protein n=1 Tax=marine sediment metagenome TaxID=412755 RepID=A0A0F8Y521_9ZZZZ
MSLKNLRLSRTRLFHENDILETKISEVEINLEKLNDANLRLQKLAGRARMIAQQAELTEALIKHIEEHGLPDHLK